MNYCDIEETIAMLNGSQNQIDDVSEILYAWICPPLVCGCLISVVLNIYLLVIGHFKIHNKTPVLLLSLNLASTDTIASLLVGIGFVVNSYLPKVYNIIMEPCPMLAFEICRTSALIASVCHLFALAFIHYRGIVKPLHYRGFSFFCTNHMTHSIHFITMISWIVPLFTFTLYFSTIPCQGFLSSTCDYLFLASKRYRFFLLTTFCIPLLLMFLLYIRIFMIISKNQKRRSQLTSHMSISETKRTTKKDSNNLKSPKRSANDKCSNKSDDDLSNHIVVINDSSSRTFESSDRTFVEQPVKAFDNRTFSQSYTENCDRPQQVKSQHQIPKINLEQKLTLKRSFYGKISFLTRTFSSKSYTMKLDNRNSPTKSKQELNILNKTKNSIKMTENGSTHSMDKITIMMNNNNPEQNNYNNCLSSKAQIEAQGNSHRIKLGGSRLMRFCANESRIFRGANDEAEKDVLKTNFLKHSYSADDEENIKQEDNVPRNGGNKSAKRYIAESSRQNSKESYEENSMENSIENDKNEERDNNSAIEQCQCIGQSKQEQLLLNKFKCNHCFDSNCRRGSSSPPDENVIERKKRNDDHHACEIVKNSSSTNSDVDKKSAKNHPKNSNQLNGRSPNAEGLEKCTISSQTCSRTLFRTSSKESFKTKTKASFKQLANCTDQEPSNERAKKLITSLSVNESNLSISNLTLSSSLNLIENSTNPDNKTTAMTVATNQQTSSDAEQANRTTPERLSLNLVKKSSISSSKSTRSIKSVEIKDDFSCPQSDKKSQRHNISRLETSCSTESPSRTLPISTTIRSHLNYPRKLRNKLNASIHGSRSVRFHTKALFTTLTILGTYLICWGPALIFLALTCIDDCAYPLFSISIKKRVVISVVTNSLVIIKAITDPFIYIYRIQEVKQAVRQCSIYKIFFIKAKDTDRYQQQKRQPTKHVKTASTSMEKVKRTRSLLISTSKGSSSCCRDAMSTMNTVVDTANHLETNSALHT